MAGVAGITVGDVVALVGFVGAMSARGVALDVFAGIFAVGALAILVGLRLIIREVRSR